MQPGLNGSRDLAIVIGGSLGGLLAARVLADHYRRVTLIERDRFPQSGENRRGVPQGRHTHGLLSSGRQVLEEMFRGISRALVEAGAVAGDIVHDSRWFNEGACLTRFQSGLEGLLMSRPFLEGMVRERVRALPNVRFREDCQVDGLTTAGDGGRVTGVSIAGETFPADLTVDASGRGSRSAQWLAEIGYEAPREERVEIALAYTTRLFRREPHHLNGDLAAIIPCRPDQKRGGVMLAQEANRWTVTLTGHFGQVAPADLPGFIEYSRTIPAPFIHEVVSRAEPLGDPVSARFPASLRRRYEQLARFPEGYLVFGDAISSFNPIYGQGMSVAALESVELAKTLRETAASPLAKRFFTRAAKVVDIPWAIAAGNDLRMPEATGARNAGVTFVNWYMSKLLRAAHHDAVPAMAFHRVANLLAPPPSVMHPRVAAHVLWANLRRPPQAPAPEQSLHAAASH
jgi:2-polyprenyl-6-methoxyphenol hydroxylase-like FAD-dependent oxidoreductase